MAKAMQQPTDVFSTTDIRHCTAYEAKNFFTGKIANGSLKAYLVEKDHQDVRENEREKIITIAKGISLLPIYCVEEHVIPVLLEDTRTRAVYSLFINTGGSGIGMGEDTDDDTFSTFHAVILDRHKKKFDELDVQSLIVQRGVLYFPQGIADAKLKMHYDNETGASLTIEPAEALNDRLFAEYHGLLTVTP